MALGVGDTVYLNVGDGLRSDPPLFGRVDVINGSTPDIVRINWENGINQTFAASAPTNLMEVAADPNQDAWLGLFVNTAPNPAGRHSGVVLRTWIEDPDGVARQTALVQTRDGNYFIEAVANLQVVANR